MQKRGDCLKIEINVEPKVKEIQVVISCNRLTPEIERVLAALRILDKKLTAIKNGENFLLEIEKVIFIETVERKTFIYTTDQVYESKLKLYELEQQLETSGFFRASKSCLIHLTFIKSLKTDLNRKIRVTLENGEQIIVSRQYAEELKKRLGVK